MRIVSVNVSMPREITVGDRTVVTGIFKEPAPGAVVLTDTNLEGDGQADRVNHGGPSKAVYAYPYEHYAYWSEELGRDDFEFGQFGENLTVEGLLESELRLGDVLEIGDAALQVAQARIPCFKLGIRMGARDFPKRFLDSGLSGFYLRILRGGTLRAGDEVRFGERGVGTPTVRQLLDMTHRRRGEPDPALARAALDLGWLSREWVPALEKLLR
jgi:MOSC domain-containing protein YiiM